MAVLLSLTLAQFRSHRLTRLEADGRCLALWGPNGAGKTNLLEAISLLSPGRGLRGAGPGELPRIGGTGWRLTALIGTPAGPREVVLSAGPAAGREVVIDGKPQPQLALAGLIRVLWLTPAMDRLWTEAAGDRRRFLDRIAMSFRPGHAEAAITYEKAMRERNRLLKDQIRDAGWFEALEAQMATSGAVIAANRQAAIDRLARAGGAEAAAFPRATLALAEPEGHPAPPDAPALRAALAAGRGRDLAAGRSLTGPHRSDLVAVYAAKGVEARLCSTGEQKALLVSLILANARALAEDTGTPPLLLLDEVAAHLDADRRAALYAEIAALGAQAVMTGTGAELFADLDAQALRVEVGETAGETWVRAMGTGQPGNPA